MTHKVELIEWIDHCSLDTGREWNPLSDAIEMTPELIRTVGWVVKENEKEIVIVGSFGQSNDQIADDTLIIKSCITRRLTLLDDSEQT